MRDALQHLTVIDFTQLAAGPTCAMLLADMGARVIKVEPPGGELGRTLGPAWVGKDSALFLSLNRNKRSICIDLKSPEGAAAARQLVQQTDVVVESMRPGVMARLGLDHATLAATNPGLVYCSISAYGQSGPCAQQAGVDGILQADSGLMGLIGTKGGAPAKVQAPVVDVMAGYMACTGILAQLTERQSTGRGGHVDINLLNAALALQQPSLASYLADGVLPARIGSAAPYSAPNEAFETADGWIMVAAYNGGRWARLCNGLGLPALALDPRFSTSQMRVRNRREMCDALANRFRSQTTAHWLTLLGGLDILCSRVSTYADVEMHPQVLANAMLVEMDHPLHGRMRSPGFPINSREANARPHAPAPDCGQHSAEILREFGFGDAGTEALLHGGAVRAAASPADALSPV